MSCVELYKLSFLRKIVVPFLSKYNFGDIRISHHHTGEKIKIHSFLHKGYWFHGKNREYDTMMAFKTLIDPGDTVIEIGGHIGYISLWFSHLVGEKGCVHVFEPGENNLPYIRENVSKKNNVCLVEKGAGSENGTLSFYLDDLSGQNNTFLQDHDEFNAVKAKSYVKDAQVKQVEVPVITVDKYVKENNIDVSFIKIDVESFECEVIKGLQATFSIQKPIVMVEIAPKNIEWIYSTMKEFGYIGYTPKLEETNGKHENVFFIHSDKFA